MSAQRTQIWASGGGVQSAAIAALIVAGRIQKPDLAAISDTHREKATTWAYMEAVTAPALASVGVELVRISARDFATVDLYGGKDGESLLIPAYTMQAGTAEPGKLPAYCSNEWKRRVVQRWATRVHGVEAADLWLGISTDEMWRLQPASRGKWQQRYPLVEAKVNRGECVGLVAALGWPPAPRSSCWMCPNQRQVEWRDTRDNSPEDWQRALEFDKAIRARDPHVYLHHDGVPLEEANLDDANEVLFGHPCSSGQCFV